MNADRPNLLLIVAEDAGRLLGCYGDRYARTPNLDRLAAEGCRFDQAYATAPVCAPARSTLVTGQYATKLGTHHMRSTLLDPPRVFTQELRDAGYRVSWPTKLDFNFEPRPGWRDDADDWLDRLRSGRPFGDDRSPWLLFTNLSATHESGMWPDDRPGRFGATPRPPAASDPGLAPVPPYLPDTPTVRADVARHYDNLAAVDARVGEILAALDDSGAAGDTAVVFLADHGRGMPREKRWCYSAGLHLPLVVRWPGRVAAGSVDDRLVSGVDLAPTLLAMAGVAAPADYDGRAFLDAAGSPVGSRAFAFAARDRMDEAFDRVRVARDRRWHYVRNFYPDLPYAQRIEYMERLPTVGEMRERHAAGDLAGDAAAWFAHPKPAEELYDLQADPACLRNLAADPGRAGALGRMSAALDAWASEFPDLGATPERDLIAAGVVADRLGEYRARIAPLPPGQRVGVGLTVIEPAAAPRSDRGAT